MKDRATTLSGRIRPNRLGRMLRLQRTIDQIGLREAARSIGISSATMMRIEHGQAFDAETLLKIWTWLLSPVGKS